MLCSRQVENKLISIVLSLIKSFVINNAHNRTQLRNRAEFIFICCLTNCRKGNIFLDLSDRHRPLLILALLIAQVRFFMRMKLSISSVLDLTRTQ